MSALRPYQQRAIEMLRERHRDRPLLCAPTGCGKTSIAAEIIRRTVERGNRAIFLVHRRELVDQAVERLAEFGVTASRILASHPEKRARPVQVASIPTLIRRAHWPAELVIVDECAHAVSASWSKILARYSDQDNPAWVIGLTATPIRLDGRGLGDLFGCIVEPVSTMALIDQGFLVEPEVFAPSVDLKGIRTRAGDYDIAQLAERMNKLTGSITDTWFKHAGAGGGKKTVVFAVNVEHSKAIAKAFRDRSVLAWHIDGGTAHKQRAETLALLHAGAITMVSNCMVLSEGWDLPDLECAILARPTKSLALFRQMVGRVMRPPGPVLVLDHAGNHHEHGCVTDPIAWSLDGREKTKSTAEPIRTCPQCFAVLPSSADVCPACGAPCPPAPVAEPPKVENPGELVRFEKMPRADKEAEYRKLVRMASQAGYKVAWARYRYRARFGTWPRFKKVERAEYRCSGHEWERKEYGWRVVRRCSRCYVEAR